MRPLSIGGPSLPNWPFPGAPPVFWLVGPRACPKLNSRGTSKEKPMIHWRKLAIGIETEASIWMNRRLCMDHTSWLPPMIQFWRSITSGAITTIHFSDVMLPINSEWLHITSRYGIRAGWNQPRHNRLDNMEKAFFCYWSFYIFWFHRVALLHFSREKKSHTFLKRPKIFQNEAIQNSNFCT